MLTSFGDIDRYSGLAVIYIAGSSGEFFSHALTLTFPDIAKFHNQFSGETSKYSHTDRVQFNDFFGRSLLTGDACVDNHPLMIERINYYLDCAVPNNGIHIGIVHPHAEYLDFLSQYCGSWKTITVTANTPTSKRFCMVSRKSKLNAGWPDYRACWEPRADSNQNLNLEWQDMILAPAHTTVSRIENFLNVKGDCNIYENLRADYVLRNQQLIDAAQNQIKLKSSR